MKAILVMDMPENCITCPLCNGNDECLMQDENANFAADTISEPDEWLSTGADAGFRGKGQADRTAPDHNRPPLCMPKVQDIQEHKPEIRFLPQLRTEIGLGAAETESVRKRSQD